MALDAWKMLAFLAAEEIPRTHGKSSIDASALLRVLVRFLRPMQALSPKCLRTVFAVPAPSGFLDFAPIRGECEIVWRRCARNDKSQTVSLRFQPLEYIWLTDSWPVFVEIELCNSQASYRSAFSDRYRSGTFAGPS